MPSFAAGIDFGKHGFDVGGGCTERSQAKQRIGSVTALSGPPDGSLENTPDPFTLGNATTLSGFGKLSVKLRRNKDL